MRRLLLSLLLAGLCLEPLPFGLAAQTNPIPAADLAAGFNPNAILDDEDLFSLEDWNAAKIQSFLALKKSALATLAIEDIDGMAKRPADIIWRVAGSYKINPKYLLALIQKEQSLVENRSPARRQLDWAAGYGVCDSCAMDDPAIQPYKGFANQLEYAAKQHRERYLFQILSRGATIAGQAPGHAVLIDGMPVVPANQATAMLYSYTPHIHGNLNLWRIWRRWFSRSLPDGTVVALKDGSNRYLIRDGARRPLSPTVFASLAIDPEKVVVLDEGALGAYPEGDALRFPNFSLVALPDGARYLLNGMQKRLIVSTKAFRALGFQEDEVQDAAPADLIEYEDGPDLTEASRYPTGLLAKDKRGATWYVEDGVRHLVPHPAFLRLYFRGRPSRTLAAAEWQRLAVGDPYRLRDGELVRGAKDPAVYVIDQGLKRAIRSGEDFLAFGYAWKNVLTLPDALLKDYPDGEPLQPAWRPPAPALAADEAAPCIERCGTGTASPTLSSTAL